MTLTIPHFRSYSRYKYKPEENYALKTAQLNLGLQADQISNKSSDDMGLGVSAWMITSELF